MLVTVASYNLKWTFKTNIHASTDKQLGNIYLDLFNMSIFDLEFPDKQEISNTQGVRVTIYKR